MADFYTLSLTVDPSGAVTGFSKASQEAEKFGKEGKKAHKDVQESADQLAETVKHLVEAYAAWRVEEYGRQAIELAGRYQELGVSMNAIGKASGMNLTHLTALQQSLQATGISMNESREAIMHMAQAEINMADATKLARVAQDAAVIGNLNSSEAFGRLIDGIEVANPLILRNLGITIQMDKAYQKYAVSIHKNVEELTEAQKKQALVNAVIEKGSLIAGTYEAAMGTATKQLRSSERYLEDFQVKLGQIFLPEYTDAVFGYANALHYMADNTAKVVGVVAGGAGAFATLFVVLKYGSTIALALNQTFAFLGLVLGELASGGLAAAGAAFATFLGPIVAAAAPLLALAAAAAAVGTIVYSYATDAALARQETQGFTETLHHLGSESIRRNIALTAAEMKKLHPESSRDDAKKWEEALAKLKAYHAELPAAEARDKAVKEKHKKTKEEVDPAIMQKILDAREKLADLDRVAAGTLRLEDVGKASAAHHNQELLGLEREIQLKTELLSTDKRLQEGRAVLAGTMDVSDMGLDDKAHGSDTLKAKLKELAYVEQAIATNKALPDHLAAIVKAEHTATMQTRELTASLDEARGSMASTFNVNYAKAFDDQFSKTLDVIGAAVGAYMGFVAAGDKVVQSMQEDADARATDNQLLHLSGDAWVKLRRAQLEYQLITRSTTFLTPEQKAQLRALIAAQAEYEETEKRFGRAAQEISGAFTTAFEGILTGGTKVFQQLMDNIKQMFVHLVSDIVMQQVGMTLVKKIAEMVGVGSTDGKSSAELLKAILGSKKGGLAGAAIGGGLIGYGYGMSVGQFGTASEYARGGIGGAASGALTGATIGSVVPGIGTAIGAVVGGLAGLVGGLFGVGRASKQAAKQMREAQQQMALSMKALYDSVNHNTLASQLDQVEQDRLARTKAINDAYPGGGSGSEQVRKRNALLAQMNALEDQYVAQLKLEYQQKVEATKGDLHARLLEAQGRYREADALRFQLAQQQEMEQALRDGTDPATIALLKQVQAQEALAFATNQASTAALNMVAGYRIQAAIFQAMTPRSTGSVVAGGGFTPAVPPVPSFGGGPGAARSSQSGDLTVVIPLDGKVVSSVVLKNFKTQAQQTKGDSTKWPQL